VGKICEYHEQVQQISPQKFKAFNLSTHKMGEHDRVSIDWEKFHNTVAGKPRGSLKIHQGVNPSDKAKLWDVPIASEHDLDDAVKSAQEAFKKWSKTTWKERQDILLQLRDELLSHRDEMAQLILRECGKPVSR
jgi:acyl-CoA reductase-like NAD-dependent aldehyde dehydrogenase